MKWSWRIGSLAGIPVFIHATFLLIVVWVILVHAWQGSSLVGTLAGLLFVAAIFGCVILHELGHALTARRFDVQTRDIILLPIGCVARLERMPERPAHEFWVAIAGPMVNVVIAILLGVGLWIGQTWQPLQDLTVSTGPFAQRLLVVNVFLFAFNLLPAFPMDGGRIFRALLAMRMDYVRATRAAASLGQGMALLFGLIGLFTNPFLILIAFFVWIGAAGESSNVELRDLLQGVPVNRTMITDFRILEPSSTLAEAARLVLQTHQQDFPVVQRGELVGLLTRSDLFRALAEQDRDAAVVVAMRDDFPRVQAGEEVRDLLPRMQDLSAVPVMDGDRLVGMMTLENLQEYLAIQAALSGRE